MSSYNIRRSLPSSLPSTSTAATATSSNEPEVIRRFISNLVDCNNNPSLIDSMQFVRHVPDHITALPSIRNTRNPLGVIGDGFNRARANRKDHKKTSKKVYSSSSVSVLDCSQCKQPSPIKYCVNCRNLLCFNCSYKVTSKCRVLQHTLLPIDKQALNRSPKTEGTYCEQHEQPMTLYCKRCTVLICQECIRYAHKDHQYTPIEGAYDRCCLEALDILEHAKINMKAIKTEIDRAANMINTFDREAAEVKTKIKETARCNAQAIKDHEKYLLDRLENIRHAKTNEFSEHMSQLHGILAGTGRINESLVQNMDCEGTLTTTKTGRSQLEYFMSMFQKMHITEESVTFILPHKLIEYLKQPLM